MNDEQRERERGCVSQHVGSVREQYEGVVDDPDDDLHRHEAGGSSRQIRCIGRAAYNASMYVRMFMCLLVIVICSVSTSK